MKKNVGSVDRLVRIVVGTAIITVGYYYGSWWGAVGLVPLVTGLASRCPVYLSFGFSTRTKAIAGDYKAEDTEEKRAS